MQLKKQLGGTYTDLEIQKLTNSPSGQDLASRLLLSQKYTPFKPDAEQDVIDHCVADNRGADFVKPLVLSLRARTRRQHRDYLDSISIINKQ